MNLSQARYLGQLVMADPHLELVGPVATSVVCLRYNPGGMTEAQLDQLNREMLLRVQENGVAAPSGTTLRGTYCLRAALCNHRTQMPDIDLFLDEVFQIGFELAVNLSDPGNDAALR